MKRLIGGDPISLTPNWPLSLGSLACTKQYQERTKKKTTFTYIVSLILTSPFGKPSLDHTADFLHVMTFEAVIFQVHILEAFCLVMFSESIS
jgi:hypothetical protein